MNIGTFEEMNENEMMAVNGGARSKSARRAAVRSARSNLTVSNVKQTAAYVAPIAITMAAGSAGAIAVGAAGLAMSWYWA